MFHPQIPSSPNAFISNCFPPIDLFRRPPSRGPQLFCSINRFPPSTLRGHQLLSAVHPPGDPGGINCFLPIESFIPNCFPTIKSFLAHNDFLQLNLSSPKCFPSIKFFHLKCFHSIKYLLPQMLSAN